MIIDELEDGEFVARWLTPEGEAENLASFRSPAAFSIFRWYTFSTPVLFFIGLVMIMVAEVRLPSTLLTF